MGIFFRQSIHFGINPDHLVVYSVIDEAPAGEELSLRACVIDRDNSHI